MTLHYTSHADACQRRHEADALDRVLADMHDQPPGLTYASIIIDQAEAHLAAEQECFSRLRVAMDKLEQACDFRDQYAAMLLAHEEARGQLNALRPMWGDEVYAKSIADLWKRLGMCRRCGDPEVYRMGVCHTCLSAMAD